MVIIDTTKDKDCFVLTIEGMTDGIKVSKRANSLNDLLLYVKKLGFNEKQIEIIS